MVKFIDIFCLALTLTHAHARAHALALTRAYIQTPKAPGQYSAKDKELVKARWTSGDYFALTNMIIELKASFLKREETKTREQLDAKDFKPFWDQLVDYALDEKNKDTILLHRFPFDQWVGNTFDTYENFYQAEGYEAVCRSFVFKSAT